MLYFLSKYLISHCRRPRFESFLGAITIIYIYIFFFFLLIDLCMPKWQPTPVSFPGKSHGQRSMVGSQVHGFTRQTRLSD